MAAVPASRSGEAYVLLLPVADIGGLFPAVHFSIAMADCTQLSIV